LLPALSGVRAYADERACAAVANGVRGDLLSLHPGLLVMLPLSSLSPGMAVVMQGHTLRVAFGSSHYDSEVAWLLPNETLVAGFNYSVQLNGTSVEVLRVV
jgi:hypothetical protein